MTECIFIRIHHGLLTKVNSRDILLVEASGGYSKMITKEGNYLVKASLSQLEQQLPITHFCRVHRAYIVAISAISSITGDTIRIPDREIPLSGTYVNQLFERLTIIC